MQYLGNKSPFLLEELHKIFLVIKSDQLEVVDISVRGQIEDLERFFGSTAQTYDWGSLHDVMCQPNFDSLTAVKFKLAIDFLHDRVNDTEPEKIDSRCRTVLSNIEDHLFVPWRERGIIHINSSLGMGMV